MSEKKSNSSKLHTFIKRIIGITFWQAIKIILGFVFTTSTFVLLSQILISSITIFTQFKWYLIIVFASGGGWIFIILYQKFQRNRPRFPALDMNFCILEKEITYEYLTQYKMVYKKRVVLKALKKDLEAYYDKYHWTGRGKVEMKSGIKSHKVRKTTPKNVWQFYEINFQRCLKKCEEIETEIIWELEDEEKVAVPFLSATIEEQTDKLILNLILPISLGVKEVICEIHSSIGAKKPLYIETKKLDRYGKVRWEIDNPKLLYHYEMRWIP